MNPQNYMHGDSVASVPPLTLTSCLGLLPPLPRQPLQSLQLFSTGKVVQAWGKKGAEDPGPSIHRLCGHDGPCWSCHARPEGGGVWRRGRE
jgi:hypothetical protein